MKNNFNDKKKDKVTLGEEQFNAKTNGGFEEELEEQTKLIPSDQDNIYDRDNVEYDEVISPSEVIVDEPVDKKKSQGKLKFFGVLIIILLLLIFFAESIRTAVFKGQDSLIFLPKDGVLIPQVGVILLVLGLLASGIALVSLFNREGKLSKKQKGLTILVGLLVAFIGFSTFFRYVDFKETTIIDKSILTTRTYPYLDINDVDASTYADGENTKLKYTYELTDGRTYEIIVTERNMEEVRAIDKKIKGTARRSIDNYAILEMERLKMYTKDEALKLFILE